MRVLRVPDLRLSPREGAAVVRIVDVAQRSPAWRQARAGRLTASRAHAILTHGRGHTEATARSAYRRQLIVERLTGRPADDGFVSTAMRHGRDQEPAARAAYAARTGQTVQTSGFVLHDELEAGCSLDGHVGAFEGLLEIKAPNTLTHLGYLASRTVPAAYRDQIRHHLWITGAAWCDFVSYDDRIWPATLQLSIVRLHREALDIPGYDLFARQFLEEVRREVARLEALPPLAFFAAAPLDVARPLLAQCVAVVEGRRGERPRTASVEARRQPALVGRAS